MVWLSRPVNTTGPPALITVGDCAVIISVPRLRPRAEMPTTAISSAAASPTTTILRWVVRSAVYIDQFMASSKDNAVRHLGRKRSRLRSLQPYVGAALRKVQTHLQANVGTAAR